VLAASIALTSSKPFKFKEPNDDDLVLDHNKSRGCTHQGKFFKPGGFVQESYSREKDECTQVRCSPRGKLIKRTTVNCKRTSTTVSSTTTILTPPTTTPATTYIGCFDESGKFFSPGEKMREGYDESSNWCYGTYCGTSNTTKNNYDVIFINSINCKSMKTRAPCAEVQRLE